MTVEADSAACFCGCGVAVAAATGAGELEGADFEERSKESEGSVFGVGIGSAFLAASSGETISTVIGSAVTVPNGCTSVKIRTAVRIDRWPIADAAMPERMNRRGSTVFNHVFRNRPRRQHSGHRNSLNPISRETEIGEPDFSVSHQGDLAHLLIGQHEVEDVDIFRQPLDPRCPRYRGNILLYEPAQANLGGGFAVRLPDLRQRPVVLDTALGDRAIGDQSHAVTCARVLYLGLIQIGMVFDLIADQWRRAGLGGLFDQGHCKIRHADMPGEAELFDMR